MGRISGFPMADIFREVDEDVRSDRLNTLWSKYSIAVYGLAAAIVIGTAGYVYVDHQRQSRDQTAGAAFVAAQQLADAGRTNEAVKAFDALAASAPNGYATLAKLRAAAETARGDRDAAVHMLDAVADDASVDSLLRDVARLRAGLLRVDVADQAELERRFGPLLNGPFRHSAREYLGLAALKRGDLEAAGKYFDEIVIDPKAPEALRQQVNAFLALVRGGGKFTPAPAAQTPDQKAPEQK